MIGSTALPWLAGLSLALTTPAQVNPRAPAAPASGEVPAPLFVEHPILFVTQVPVPDDGSKIGSVFANHLATPASAPRGGDLWIRYPNGALRNLTAEAGYGELGLQGAGSIAVRQPSVHWSGTKAVFSMVVGSPAQQGQAGNWRWQLYEVSGLELRQTASVAKVPGQPAQYNNVSPCYASDGRILFTSDRPRDGSAHLYPQLDEYETQWTTTGLWSLAPGTGELFLMQHSPSGSFTPIVDSFGRVVFTRWDHLERDSRADIKWKGGFDYGTFNYTGEGPNSTRTANDEELFPEPNARWIEFVRNQSYSGPLRGYRTNLQGNTSNHFFPWTVFQDGSGEETLNHVGRHELFAHLDRTLNDDPNLVELSAPDGRTANANPVHNLLQIREDPDKPGVYYAVDAVEFGSHAAGQVLRFHGPPGMSPDEMTVEPVTHPDTAHLTNQPSADHSGLYRSPLPLHGRRLLAVHTAETRADANVGTATAPRSRYDFRLRLLEPRGIYQAAAPELTPGFYASVSWYDPDRLVTYSGPLWELDPVEVARRPVPLDPRPQLPGPERAVLQRSGVTPQALRDWLVQRDLALIVMRDITSRDHNDRQQPFNLRVAGTTHQKVAAPGRVYDVAWLQLFQADQLRGLTHGTPNPLPGRRVLAQPMHHVDPALMPDSSGPAGAVPVARDGSVAALVPARRAMTWQLTAPNAEPVVRERYWVTFQPGEVRSCTSCHGLSSSDQLGGPPPSTEPRALEELLQYLKELGEL